MSTAPSISRPAALDELEAFEQGLRQLVEREDAPLGVDELRKRAADTRDRLTQLADQGIALELDPDLRLELAEYSLAALEKLRRSIASTDDERRRHLVAQALTDIEALRHIVRDGIDHEPLRSTSSNGQVLLSRSDAVRHVEEWLPRLSRAQVAQLLGTDARGLLRWRADADTPASRVAEMAVTLIGVLRHSWTDEGVVRWFERPHPLLGGRTPHELIDDPDQEGSLRDAARIGRTQTAA